MTGSHIILLVKEFTTILGKILKHVTYVTVLIQKYLSGEYIPAALGSQDLALNRTKSVP